MNTNTNINTKDKDQKNSLWMGIYPNFPANLSPGRRSITSRFLYSKERRFLNMLNCSFYHKEYIIIVINVGIWCSNFTHVINWLFWITIPARLVATWSNYAGPMGRALPASATRPRRSSSEEIQYLLLLHLVLFHSHGVKKKIKDNVATLLFSRLLICYWRQFWLQVFSLQRPTGC